MWLSRLDVEDVRILQSAWLRLDPQLNVITGGNAAGKTSLLEAVHVLGTGRSFAAGTVRPVVRLGSGPLRVVARLRQGDARERVVGFERAASGRPRVRLDGAEVSRVSELARVLPLVTVHPGSHELIAGGPGERRRYIDRGLFHVEQGFQPVWQTYRRAVEQRNALLRSGRGDSELASWEREVARVGTALDGYRQAYVTELSGRFARLGAWLLGETVTLAVRYRPGWDRSVDLADALAAARPRDRERQRSSVGPHCGDLRLEIDGRAARETVSRGQQKLLAYALRLAQAEQLVACGGCVLLLDDLPAELDRQRCDRVLSAALGVGAQVLVTALASGDIEIPSGYSVKRFHVEQGAVTELIQ